MLRFYFTCPLYRVRVGVLTESNTCSPYVACPHTEYSWLKIPTVSRGGGDGGGFFLACENFLGGGLCNELLPGHFFVLFLFFWFICGDQLMCTDPNLLARISPHGFVSEDNCGQFFLTRVPPYKAYNVEFCRYYLNRTGNSLSLSDHCCF